ncbi:MAG: single-stranded-DNA-specific exonuclease RecJ [Fusobacteriaceae bacterium]|nr:single-stranded-DNA-specific exonuclease RecJ [Fusobacteriaceae bacterium]
MKWEHAVVDNKWLEAKRTELKLPDSVLKLLYNRELLEKEDIDRFLANDLNGFRNPFNFERMEEAIEKILKIKTNNETLYIYGDYDVDGITATAFLTLVFRKVGINVKYYIPNRMDEGYGLNKKALTEMNNNNCKLVITVDTGVNSIEEIKYARQLGIDIIITDHHKLVEEEDKEILTINPKLSKNYPFKYLSGAGVALKLAQALYKKLDEDFDKLYKYIDIIMIGTVADVVPMVDENRLIIHKGLEVIKKTKIKGLTYLLKYLKFGDKDLTTTDISFFISPLLNALGRVGDSTIGVDFFVEEDEFVIYNIIEEMKKSNKKRRSLERNTFNDIDRKYSLMKNIDFIFEASEEWHPGIIGVVSSRLALKYHVPVILVTIKGGFGKASCRSIEEVNIFDILNEISKEFIRFGGHDLAAGFVVSKDKLDFVKDKVGKAIRDGRGSHKERTVKIDYEVSLESIDDEFLRNLKRLSPYGLENPQPLFLDRDLEFIGTKKFGVEDRHFKTFLKKDNKLYSAVAFNLGDKIEDKIYPFQKFDIVYYPEKIYYKGEEILQIKIKDFQYKDEFYNIFEK